MKTKLLLLVLLLSFSTSSRVYAKPSSSETINFHGLTADGLLKAAGEVGYPILWNYSTGTVFTSLNLTSIGQKNDFIFGTLDYDEIYRTVLFFDTSTLPNNAKIESAQLKIYGNTIFEHRSFNIVIQKGASPIPHNPLETGDYWQGYYSGSGGELASSEFQTDDWNIIELSELSWISIYGETSLCLRSNRDINEDEPPNMNYEYVIIATGDSEHQPVLSVTYIQEGAAGELPPPWLRVKWNWLRELLKVKVQAPIWALWTRAQVTINGVLSTIGVAIFAYFLYKIVYRTFFKRKWRIKKVIIER